MKYEYGKASFEKLKAAGANADFKTYKHLQHGVDPQEVQVGQLCVCTHCPGCTSQEASELVQVPALTDDCFPAGHHGILGQAFAQEVNFQLTPYTWRPTSCSVFWPIWSRAQAVSHPAVSVSNFLMVKAILLNCWAASSDICTAALD